MDPGFRLEYAKSGRAECKRCGSLIAQDSLRVGVESKSSYHDGFDVSWVHFRCAYGMTWSKVQGCEMLRWDDQEKVRSKCGEPFPSNWDKKAVKANIDELWDMKDEVSDNLKTKELVELVEANGYTVKKKNVQSLTHKVADGLLNGLIGPCPSCKKTAVLRYNGAEFKCVGWQTAYVRCNWTGSGEEKGEEVKRYKFKIPDALKKKNKWLKAFKYGKGYPKESLGSGAGDDDEEEESEVESGDLEKPEDKIPKGLELYGIVILVAGNKSALGATMAEIREQVEDHGGETTEDPDEATVAISSEKMCNAKKKSKKLTAALKRLPVVSIDWLDALCDRKKGGLALRSDAKKIKPFLIAGDLDGPLYFERYDAERVAKREAKEAEREEADAKKEAERSKKRKRAEPVPGSEILRVDPDTGKSSNGEIHVTYDDKYGYTPYNCTLNFTDLQTGVNKYYKMQIVKVGKSFWFWISYGRVGVDSIGDQKIYKKSEKGAIEAWEEKFLKFTGQEWEDRDIFEKKPGKYYMIELDDGIEEDEDEETAERRRKRARKAADPKMAVDGPKTVLDKQVRNLVQMIFDKTSMQKTLAQQDVDLRKMPLGKISKRQIKQGYAVLNDCEKELKKKSPNRATLADLSTRFYTLVPHDFGQRAPPLIEDAETVSKKMKLLEALIDIGIAAEATEAAEAAADPLVAQYESLDCKLETLDQKSETFKMIKKYMENQRGMYNRHKIEEAFEVSRNAEVDAFEKKRKALGNVHLLWHGSGMANYVGILSQGLRIAPPEAPCSGYRLGKGVYLADLYEKSAGYCRGGWSGEKYILIMLCEGVMGEQFETKRDHYMEAAQPGSHSTKALGSQAPGKIEMLGDVKVPCGKAKATGISSSFRHNEYVVYRKDQVFIRYLLKVKMN